MSLCWSIICSLPTLSSRANECLIHSRFQLSVTSNYCIIIHSTLIMSLLKGWTVLFFFKCGDKWTSQDAECLHSTCNRSQLKPQPVQCQYWNSHVNQLFPNVLPFRTLMQCQYCGLSVDMSCGQFNKKLNSACSDSFHWKSFLRIHIIHIYKYILVVLILLMCDPWDLFIFGPHVRSRLL